MSVPGAQRRIVEATGQWAEVEIKPHRFSGLEVRLGRRELGHIHGDRLLDIPFPKSVRDELVASGLAEPHHVLPDSGWVSVSCGRGAVPRAIRLLERSFSLAAAAASGPETLGASLNPWLERKSSWASYTNYQRIYAKTLISDPKAMAAGRILRQSRATNGSVGLSPPKNRRRGATGSKGRAPGLQTENAVRAVGPAALHR